VLCEGSSTRWPTAGEDATAATRATPAATRNNEQKIRRHGDSADVRCEFVIIELPVRCWVNLLDSLRAERRDDAFTSKHHGVSIF
jgi:hypothetical protein